jgi:hypothetical protein
MQRDLAMRLLLLAQLFSWSAGASAQSVAAPSTSPIKAGDKAPLVAVVLRPHGFEPAKITLNQNTVILYVMNRAGGKGDPDLTILPNVAASPGVSPAAAQAYTAKSSQNGLDLWRIVTLTKGSYTLTMSNHGTAKLEIEVTK